MTTSNYIVSALILVACLFAIKLWFGELRFYKGNNWNFSKNNPKGGGVGFGLEGGEPQVNVSNEARVLIAYPFIIAILIGFGIMFLFIRLD